MPVRSCKGFASDAPALTFNKKLEQRNTRQQVDSRRNSKPLKLLHFAIADLAGSTIIFSAYYGYFAKVNTALLSFKTCTAREWLYRQKEANNKR